MGKEWFLHFKVYTIVDFVDEFDGEMRHKEVALRRIIINLLMNFPLHYLIKMI